MKHIGFSKKNKLVTTYVILGAALLLSIGVIIISTLLRNDASSTPIATTKIRAASLTYKRTITIVNVTSTPPPLAGAATATSTPSPTPTQTTVQATITAQQKNGGSNTQSSVTSTPGTATPTLRATATASPTPVEIATDTPVLTPDETTVAAAASTTPASTLPESGTVQYTSMIFITASIVLFISFLF